MIATDRREKLKIAMLLFRVFPHGGLQTDCRRIAEKCVRRGHDVTIFCGSWSGPAFPDIRTRLIPCKCLSNHRSAQCFEAKVNAILQRENFDVVMGFNRMAGLDVYFAADSCFADSHKGWFGRLFSPRTRVFRRMEKAVFAPASRTRILALTREQQQIYMKQYRTPEERFTIIPPGIAESCRMPEDRQVITRARQKIFSEFAIPQNAKLLIEIGSSFHTKGVDRNILAWPTLPPDVHLLVAGREKSSRFRRLTETLGMAHRIHFAGPRDDVPELLFAADGMVHPARVESAGNVLAEAAAAGLPVLCSGICGYADLVHAAGGMVQTGEFRQADWNRLLAEFLAGLDERRKLAMQYARTADLFRRADVVVDELERLDRQ